MAENEMEDLAKEILKDEKEDPSKIQKIIVIERAQIPATPEKSRRVGIGKILSGGFSFTFIFLAFLSLFSRVEQGNILSGVIYFVLLMVPAYLFSQLFIRTKKS